MIHVARGAQDQGRPGKNGPGPEPPGPGRSLLPRPYRRGTGQTIISGMGELHLEILVDRMKREFNVEANVGQPQVAYREAIRKAVEQKASSSSSPAAASTATSGSSWSPAGGGRQGLRVRGRHQGRYRAPRIHPRRGQGA